MACGLLLHGSMKTLTTWIVLTALAASTAGCWVRTGPRRYYYRAETQNPAAAVVEAQNSAAPPRTATIE